MLCVRCKKRTAVVFVQRIENGKPLQEGYCLTCARALHIQPVDDLMKQFGMSDQDLENMEERMSSFLQEAAESGALAPTGEDAPEEAAQDDFVPGGSPTFPFGPGAPRPGGEEGKERKNGRQKAPRRKFLDTYCENLTQKARDGKTDRIIGRDREIYRTIQILCRRQKNNPCLIGEAGVGKTAIAEGIAQRIAEGKVPARLQDKEIYLLDMTALIAGTQFRGQFEQRVKGLISEVKAAGNIILFIDEIHSIVGAGDSDGAMNAANIMKPGALPRADAGHRRHHLLGIPQIYRKRFRAGTPLPACQSGGTLDPRHHRGAQGHPHLLREAPLRPRAGPHRDQHRQAVGTLHHRPLPARQGHRPAGRSLRLLQPAPPGDHRADRGPAPCGGTGSAGA